MWLIGHECKCGNILSWVILIDWGLDQEKNWKHVRKEDKEKRSLYKYPHNYGGYVEQQYLPDSLKGKKYYVPKDNGYEKTIKEIRQRKGKK